ncbi:unnamed protein product [Pedinophyceae sp. YPF-701]|nr:unnamed protein product [Pedinophyceae sp. YPF-701]
MMGNGGRSVRAFKSNEGHWVGEGELRLPEVDPELAYEILSKPRNSALMFRSVIDSRVDDDGEARVRGPEWSTVNQKWKINFLPFLESSSNAVFAFRADPATKYIEYDILRSNILKKHVDTWSISAAPGGGSIIKRRLATQSHFPAPPMMNMRSILESSMNETLDDFAAEAAKRAALADPDGTIGAAGADVARAASSRGGETQALARTLRGYMAVGSGPRVMRSPLCRRRRPLRPQPGAVRRPVGGVFLRGGWTGSDAADSVRTSTSACSCEACQASPSAVAPARLAARDAHSMPWLVTRGGYWDSDGETLSGYGSARGSDWEADPGCDGRCAVTGGLPQLAPSLALLSVDGGEV